MELTYPRHAKRRDPADALFNEHLELRPTSFNVSGVVQHAPLQDFVSVDTAKAVTIAI